MDRRICGLGIELVYSPEFINEVERIIDLNLNTSTELIGLFISRLIKGLQNLSNSDSEFRIKWGIYEYEIEDIGTVGFLPLFDPESGERVLHIQNIAWHFATSRFFGDFIIQ